MHGRRWYVLFILCVFFLVAVTISHGQDMTGSVEGRLVDSLGSPIPTVNVTVAGANLQGVRGTSTDNLGYFRVLALPVGSYTINVSHVAYQDITYENVPVRLGKTNSIGDIILASRVANMPEVIISGARPVIDAASIATGTNFTAGTIAPLPTDRNFRSIITLAPGANSSSYPGEGTNISGSTGNENLYFIDGINVTEVSRASTSADLPYNFVREVEVKTGGYEAEYASALGGIVNVITKSGSNDFRGQLFGFFANNGLMGKRRPGFMGETISRFSSYDIGFSLGGPIVRDQLWFYGAYNPSFEEKDITIPGLGTYPDRKQSHLFAGKLNWRAGENTNTIFSMIGDPSNQDAISFNSPNGGYIAPTLSNIDPLLQNIERGGVNMSLQANHSIGDKVLLEASVSRFDRRDKQLPRTEIGRNESMYTDMMTGITSGGVGGSLEYQSTRWSARLSGILFLSSHTLKAGFEYEDNRNEVTEQIHAGVNNQYPAVVQRLDDTTYLAFTGFWSINVYNRIPAVFVQDSWLLSDRLRLNVGLRWTGQFFIGSNGKVAQKITDELQPRLGFTYQPGNRGAQKMYGSYGRFYEQVPLNLPTLFYSERAEYAVFYDHDPRENSAGGDSLAFLSAISPAISDLKGQHFDEFSLGYEQRLGEDFKIGIRGVYRNLLQVIEDGYNQSTGEWVAGNPGKGALSSLPKFTRQYKALEFTMEKSGAEGLTFLASYILSRSYGNYPGLFNGDYAATNLLAGNTNCGTMDTPDQFLLGDGLLPNDRTHVFKFSGSYTFGSGLSLGTTFIAQSGVPLNEFGSSLMYGELPLQKRGTAGRAPATWDLNMRATYSLASITGASWEPKFIVDVFHLFSQRKALFIDQFHYLFHDENGNQIAPNPTYGQVYIYQPPMSVRVGMELNF